MKKIIALLLVVCFIFSFAACKGNEDSGASDEIADKSSDVAANVVAGKIPELKFAIGAAVADVDNYYKDIENQMEEGHEGAGHVHTDEDMLLSAVEGYLSFTYEIGDAKYFYEKAKKDKGISVVCSLGDAFGIKQGAVKSEVEAALSELELKTVQAGDNELYFVPLIEAIILRYKNGNMQLDFYFSNNELVATVLRNTENWTI